MGCMQSKKGAASEPGGQTSQGASGAGDTAGAPGPGGTAAAGAPGTAPAPDESAALLKPLDDTAECPEPRPPEGRDWFATLFGFQEPRDYEEARKFLKVGAQQGKNKMLSLVNRKVFKVGIFETPSLAELRRRGQPLLTKFKGRCVFKNIVGDVAQFHNDAQNCFATFQVASQFNCLEFVDPSVTPEDGVTIYERDKTQGPACSIACAPATVYRNYFYDWKDGTTGQRKERMINNLDAFSKALGDESGDKFFSVRGGYTESSEEKLRALGAQLEEKKKEGVELGEHIKLGVHQDVQVTSGNWGRQVREDDSQEVTQVFGAACAIAYSYGTRRESWEPLARLILDASYEATLWAGLEAAKRHNGEKGSRKVFLTCLGAGVFGNPMDWVYDSMKAAMTKFKDCDLEVICVTYSGTPHSLLQKLAGEFPADATAPPP